MNHHLVLLSVCMAASLVRAFQNVTVNQDDPNVTYYSSDGVPERWYFMPLDVLQPGAGAEYKRSSDSNATAILEFWGVALSYVSPIWAFRASETIQIDQNPPSILNLFNQSVPASGNPELPPVSFRTYVVARNLTYGRHTAIIKKIDSQPYVSVNQFIVTVPDFNIDPGVTPSTTAPITSAPSSSGSLSKGEKSNPDLRLIIPLVVGGTALLALFVALIWMFKFRQYCCFALRKQRSGGNTDKRSKPRRWLSMKRTQNTPQDLGEALAYDSPHVQRMQNFETLSMPSTARTAKKSSNGEHYYPPLPVQKSETDLTDKSLPTLPYLAYTSLLTDNETSTHTQTNGGENLRSKNPYRASLSRSTSAQTSTLHGSPPSSSMDHITSPSFHQPAQKPHFPLRSAPNSNHGHSHPPQSGGQSYAGGGEVGGPTISHPYQFSNQLGQNVMNSAMAPNLTSVNARRPGSSRSTGRERGDMGQTRHTIHEETTVLSPQPFAHPAPQAADFTAISAISGPPRTPSRTSAHGHQRNASSESRPRRRSLPIPPQPNVQVLPVQHVHSPVSPQLNAKGPAAQHVSPPVSPVHPPPPSSFGNNIGSATSRYYPPPVLPNTPFENADIFDDRTFGVSLKTVQPSYDPVWRPDDYGKGEFSQASSPSNSPGFANSNNFGRSSSLSPPTQAPEFDNLGSLSHLTKSTHGQVNRPPSRTKTPIANVSHLQGTRL